MNDWLEVQWHDPASQECALCGREFLDLSPEGVCGDCEHEILYGTGNDDGRFPGRKKAPPRPL